MRRVSENISRIYKDKEEYGSLVDEFYSGAYVDIKFV